MGAHKIKGYHLQICDFGYSTIGATSLIELPSSWLWTAPEHHDRLFTLLAAKKTDIYSLSLVFVWLLFVFGIKNDPSLPLSLELSNEIEVDLDTSTLIWLDHLRNFGSVSGLISQCINRTTCFSSPQKQDLQVFFASALETDPSKRFIKCVGVFRMQQQNGT